MKYIDSSPPIQSADDKKDIARLISFDEQLKEELNQALREIGKSFMSLSENESASSYALQEQINTINQSIINVNQSITTLNGTLNTLTNTTIPALDARITALENH